VPKKPQTINGPWNVSQLAFPPGSGRFTGSRTNPPQTPQIRQAMPISNNGNRPTRLFPSEVMIFQAFAQSSSEPILTNRSMAIILVRPWLARHPHAVLVEWPN
jgi:hypothetical protein